MPRDTVQPNRLRLILLQLVFVLALGHGALAASADELTGFARGLGITDTRAFLETIQSLELTGKLPSFYLSKDEAERLGWRPGMDLWAVARGKAIGGDVFANRERSLPAAPGRRYREADLDYRGGPRNAKRLIFGSDGEIWVTVDHYRSFRKVPK